MGRGGARLCESTDTNRRIGSRQAWRLTPRRRRLPDDPHHRRRVCPLGRAGLDTCPLGSPRSSEFSAPKVAERTLKLAGAGRLHFTRKQVKRMRKSVSERIEAAAAPTVSAVGK